MLGENQIRARFKEITTRRRHGGHRGMMDITVQTLHVVTASGNYRILMLAWVTAVEVGRKESRKEGRKERRKG